MNRIIEEILVTGMTRLENGEEVPVHSAISGGERKLIQRVLEDIRPSCSLEVGMAYGISTVTICEALAKVNGTCHIAIDPDQHTGRSGDGWRGGGLANISRAGFEGLVKFYEAPSHLVLPKLEEAGVRIGFALIDGWPTFDYRIMDFTMIDRLLDIGGVVVMSAANMPGVRKACRFIATNRGYRIYDAVTTPHDAAVLSRPHRRSRGLELPERVRRHLMPELRETDEELGLGRKSCAVAFLKEEEDHRLWDYHEEF